jgi:hypothetical protein
MSASGHGDLGVALETVEWKYRPPICKSAHRWARWEAWRVQLGVPGAEENGGRRRFDRIGTAGMRPATAASAGAKQSPKFSRAGPGLGDLSG